MSFLDNHNAESSDTWRRCALVLHALDATDRSWLLDNLEPSHRSPLQDLVAELQDLGITPDPQLALAATAGNSPGASGAASSPKPSSGLHDVGDEDLVHFLANEPPGIIAAVVQGLALSRRESVLASLGRPLRRQVTERLENGNNAARHAPLLQQALSDELCVRLGTRAAKRPAPFRAIRQQLHSIRRRFKRART